MIWIDSSFAVEWLLGTARARHYTQAATEACSILDSQYCEVVAFFLRRSAEEKKIIDQLEALFLDHPQKRDLAVAAKLHLAARKMGSKASLSDAVLSAVVLREEGSLLAFDSDFASLGLKSADGGLWVAA